MPQNKLWSTSYLSEPDEMLVIQEGDIKRFCS
jgi:hypothetical protein